MLVCDMDRSGNILQAIEDGNSERFLAILDAGFRSAARKASEESHALGLEVADGRAREGSKSGLYPVLQLIAQIRRSGVRPILPAPAERD